METRSHSRALKTLALLFMAVLLFTAPFAFRAAATAKVNVPVVTCPLRVDASAGPGGNGASWATAYNDLQAAINVAAANAPCQVWVKAGTYKPTSSSDPTATFTMKTDVAVYGGFAGTETSLDQRDWVAHVTSLSGDIGTPGDASDNSYHVVYADNIGGSAALDGFTITGGNAVNDFSSYYYGGGLYVHQATFALSNVIFQNNHAVYYGGGLYASNDTAGQTLTMENVKFQNNSAIRGGGVYLGSNTTVVANTLEFTGNLALTNSSFPIYVEGGGLWEGSTNNSLTVYGATFTNNYAVGDGGGASIQGHAVLDTLLFQTNGTHGTDAPTFSGGGLYISLYGISDVVQVTNATFAYNSSVRGALGLDYAGTNQAFVTNALFYGNSSTMEGSAIELVNSTPVLDNMTLYGNTANCEGGAIYFQQSNAAIYNSILWDNTDSCPSFGYPDVFVGYLAAPTFAHSLVQGCKSAGVWDTTNCGADGGGNLTDTDPLFLNPSSYNYYLQSNSPVINKGDNSYASLVTRDLASFPRISGGRIDLGAYEYQWPFAVFLPVVFR